MSCSADYAPRLRYLGFRVTPQRMAILHVLRRSGSHLSPSQVFAKARLQARGITQPTVYRTLEFLARIGLVQPALDAQKHLVYQIAAHAHHHLTCSRCGADVELDHSLVDGLYRDLQASSGYRLTDNHLTLFGLCPACTAKMDRG